MSQSNPMHHTTSGQTRRSELKEEREWKDLQKAKRAYVKRKAQEDEAERCIRYPDGEEDDSIVPF